eukprot:scaffold22574_cov125-Cylindrotheca_fusiformis.AAC.16
MTSYPLEARVLLHGLVKAPDLNGKVGVVKSGMTNGRYQVFIQDLAKSVALKSSNLRYEGRSAESLSIKELKTVLLSKGVAESELTGIDKSDLQSKLSNLQLSEEGIAELLAMADAPKPASTTRHSNPSMDPTQAASQLENMSPDQLRQQARAMKTMDPATIRRMNPQFANMTDSQLQMAADQMLMMADNPEMLKAASNQIKNMSPQEIQRMQSQMVGGNQASTTTSAPAANRNRPATTAAAAATATATATPKADQFQKASDMMANMTPEQLRQQAQMMRTMEPDAIRRMNPQLANMTDEQIKASASQFDMMANNPELMKMAMDQMKNLTPEQIAAMQNGDPAQPNPNQPGVDPASMLANMDKKQLRQMLRQLSENPEMMKQFAKSSGLSEEQLAQGVEMFAKMEDDKLDKAVNLMQKAQKAKDLWTKADAKSGGHLKKIIIGVMLLVVVLMVKKIWFSSGGQPQEVADPIDSIPDIAVAQPAEVDEFESEF